MHRIVLLLLIISAPLLAKISIIVKEKGTSRSLSRVEISSGEQTLYTDKDGFVELDILSTPIKAYKAGYEKLELTIRELNENEGIIYLIPNLERDEKVRVRGKRRIETSQKRVTIEEAIKVAPGGDPAQIPKLLPGVAVRPFQNQLVVRGSGPEDSRYYLDQIEVPFIYHGIGGISIVPDRILDDVTFNNGGFGAQYGGATGGILTLQTKDGVESDGLGELRTNIPLYASVYYESSFQEKYSVSTAYRRSFIEVILPSILSRSEMDNLTVVPYFGDINLLLRIFFLEADLLKHRLDDFIFE